MTDWLNKCHFGDVRDVLRQMIADGVKVNTIVTSPPYWGLRSYLPSDHADKSQEIGSEPTLKEFLATMVEVFDLCREVLRDDGTMWVNMGDSYAGSWGAQSRGGPPSSSSTLKGNGHIGGGPKISQLSAVQALAAPKGERTGSLDRTPGLKPKDLMGQPWRLAFALQDAGWYLRQDIIWAKPNPMPESIKDRCTKAHEYIFLLSKSERYYYDFDAMQEPVNGGANPRRATIKAPDGWATHAGGHGSFHKDGREKGATVPAVGRREGPPGNPAESKFCALTGQNEDGVHRTKAGLDRKLAEPGRGVKNNGSMDEALAEMRDTRNRRSVWTVPSEPFSGAHFATFPRALIEPCVLAGAPAGGVVLDIFMGSGTTAQVAEQLGRKWIGIDIDSRNKALQDERLRQPSLDLESA